MKRNPEYSANICIGKVMFYSLNNYCECTTEQENESPQCMYVCTLTTAVLILYMLSQLALLQQTPNIDFQNCGLCNKKTENISMQ